MKIRRRDLLRGSLVAGAAGAVGAAGALGENILAEEPTDSPPPAQAPDGDIVPVDLRCEYLREPLGIDARLPHLGWRLEATVAGTRGLRQSAYRVLVASSPALLGEGAGDLWDSGRVESDEQLHIEYGGRPLMSGQPCHWKVRVWDGSGRPCAWSGPASWEMGLLEPTDWTGEWVGDEEPEPAGREAHYEDHPAPLLRRPFEVSKPVARARLHAAGLGYYELRLNGVRVSDHVLDPAWTSFGERVPYTSHDVTALLNRGPNVVAAMLGNGWYNPLPLQMWGRINIREHLLTGQPGLIAQLNIEYEDGTTQSVATDESWQVHSGPVIRNSVYLGEVYDARREQPGWDRQGFDASGWRPASLQRADELGALEAQSIPPIRVTATLEPQSMTEVAPGVFIFDMGQNFAGWARLRVQGPRGTTVKMRTGELLHADGTLNPMTAVAGQIKGANADGSPRGGAGAPLVAEQCDSYTLSGDGLETYTPRFTFHGFRYVEVTGFPGRPRLETIEGLRLNTDVEAVGRFACSDETLNQIQDMVQWTLLSNLFSVQSDCPAREKFQYGGDIVATSEMASLNYDFASFYTKTVRDHADAARGGWFTETAPFVGISADNYVEDAGPIGWGLAHPLLVAQLYQYYGDRRIVAEQYEAARRWVDLLDRHSDGHIVDRCIGDHESLDPKPVALTATAHYGQAAQLVSRFAGILGKEADRIRYERLAGQIRNAFVARFLAPGTGVFDIGTQTCQATALTMGLVPVGERGAAIDRMVDQVLVEHDGHVATGIFGTKYLLAELTHAGHADVALQMVQQPTFPGWGHMLDRGATTVWEHWEFSDNTYSHNHPMFGSVSEWFYSGIGGIRPHAEAVGFDRFLIEPNPVGDLRWAETRYRSARGTIVSDWRVENDLLYLEVEVPVNAAAEVLVPTRSPQAVTESDGPADAAAGVISLPIARGGGARFELSSGRYRFVAPL